MEGVMKNVAITGVSGYLGALLAKRLAQEAEVERIIGIDIKEPEIRDPKLKFIQHDVRKPFADIFVGNKIDTAIHFAFITWPIHAERRAREIDIEGSKNFLVASKQAKVEQIFYMGSNTEYGANPDNPKVIKEDTPLRPNRDFPYPVDKTEVDLMFQGFASKNPDIRVTIGRTVPVTGPGGDKCGLTVLFLPVMVKAMGYDPVWQFIHEEDLVNITTTLLKQRKVGIFNFTGDSGLKYGQMIKILGKPSLTLPVPLLYWGTRISWRTHLQSKAQAGGVHMLKHTVNLSNEKVRKETGYQFKYTGPEAFSSFLKATGKLPTNAK